MRKNAGQARLFAAAELPVDRPVHVVGVGDAGCRMASEVRRRSIRGVEVACLDTDSASLDRSSCDKSVLLGAASMHGFGSGGDAGKVAAAVEEQSASIADLVSGAECVVVLAGLAGGTGAGAAPAIADIASKTGALVVALPVMPFDFEPIGTHLMAADAFDSLRKASDSVLEIPQPDPSVVNHTGVPLADAFEADRRYAASFVATLAAITTAGPGRCDADPGDLRSVLRNGATGIFGSGSGYAHTGATEAARACLEMASAGKDSLLNVDRALVVVESGPDLPVSYVATITATMEARLGADAEIHTAVMRSRLLAGSVRISLIGSRRQLKRPLVVDSGQASRELAPVELIDSAALLSSSLT